MATPLAVSEVYTYKGIAKVYFSTSIADITAPTRLELDTSTDLSCQLGDIIGWEITSQIITDPNWGSFMSQRPGSIMVDPAQLLLRADLAGNDIRTLLSRGTTGWVLILPSGDVEGHPMNVYPVRVAATSQSVRIRGVAYILVTFSVTSRPAENVAVPAP